MKRPAFFSAQPVTIYVSVRRRLDLRDNRLTRIAPLGPTVRHVEMSGNSLVRVDRMTWSRANSLGSLDLSSRLVMTDAGPRSSGDGFAQTRLPSLADQMIASIEDGSFVTPECLRTMTSCSQLTSLNVSGNRLSGIEERWFDGLINLDTLDLSR